MIIYWKSRDYQILYFFTVKLFKLPNRELRTLFLRQHVFLIYDVYIRECTADTLTRQGTRSLGHRVSGSFGSSFTSGSPGHRVIILTRCETRVFPVFEKKAQDKDIKIYILVKIRPTVIEILTFNKQSSKFYFPEACKRQTAIKTGKPLAHCKRLSAT